MFVTQFSNVGKGFDLSKDELPSEEKLVPFFKNSSFIKDCSAILLNYLLNDKKLLN